MIQKLLLILCVVFLWACKNTNKQSSPTLEETFNSLDSHVLFEWNRIISEKKLTTPETIIKQFVGEYQGEGFGEFTIHQTTEDQKTIITFLQIGIPDDSIKGRKIIMELVQEDLSWKIIAVKKNYMCHENRGHTYWSAEPCH